MARAKYLKTGGIAALAAGVALAVLPAVAQAQDHGDRGGGWEGHGGGNGGGGNRGNQTSPTPTPAPAPHAQTQQQQQQQHNWSGGNRGGGGQGGNFQGGHSQGGNFRGGGGQNGGQQGGGPWSQRGNNQVRPQYQSQGAQRNYADGGSAEGRNRSYVDPNRNNSYRDPNRDQYRNGFRGGESFRGNDDRFRGNDNSRWRGNNQGYVRNWSRDWRGDNRYDWRGYRDSHRDVFRGGGAYYAPYRGYSYRRLGVGFYLDSLFFGSRYWINDPWQYRLPPVDGPFRWVRYYDDALLVDTETGEVVDVINDFFW